MPQKDGKYFPNTQKMNAASKSPAPAAAPAPIDDAANPSPDIDPCFALYDNGDGTGYSMDDAGTRTEIPDLEMAKQSVMDAVGADQSMQQDPGAAMPETMPTPSMSGLG